MSQRYFGTDGIRGTVGGPVMNEMFVRRVGYALAKFLKKHNQAKPITVAVGRDTRASGEMIQEALCQGLCAEGLHVVRLGVTPSPAVSMSVRDLHADMGISITASHNPATDNGIKLYDNRGLKFAPAAEGEIEAFIEAEQEHEEGAQFDCGYDHDSRGYYANFMRSLLHQSCLDGWKVVLDTANGAACETSSTVFRHFGADLIHIGDKPDGQNINEGLGSEHPEVLCEAVRKHGARLGIAHDGDADRVVFCDETGSILAGEEVLGAVALDLHAQGKLNRKTVVTTVQSNLGLDRALADAGISTIRVPVGDRNVLMAMQDQRLSLGGESSGHYLLFEHSVSGDGLLMAITIVDLMLRSGKALSELRQAVRLFPLATENLRVAEKRPLEDCASLQTAQAEVAKQLGDRGRLLLRYSGTEPKLRFLVEAEEAALIAPAMSALVAAARQDLEII